MHFSSFSHSSHSTAFHPNQDIVLEQFYQQRKKRGKNMGKRHSLLQKNTSYFANNSQLNDSSSSMRKRQDNKQQNDFHGKSFKQSNFKDSKKVIQPTIKQQINQRKLSISEAQIMKKYAIQGKQNYTTPTTPNSRCLSQSGFKKQKTNFQLNISTQSKCNQRKKNLQQLQTNFKILTGQEPERKKTKEVSSKEGVVAANLKQRLKNIVVGGSNEINENADNSRHVQKTEKHQSHIEQQYMKDNIKIINKVRSSSVKSNSKGDHQFFKKDMVSIKQFVANNSFSKKEEQEPLLVLAQENSTSAYQRSTKLNSKYEEEFHSAYNLHTQEQSRFFKEEEQEQFVASPNFKMSAVIEEEERIRSKINRDDDSRVSKGCLKQSKFGLVGSRASYLDNSHHINEQSSQDWNYSSYNSNPNTSKIEHQKQGALMNKPDIEKQKMQKRIKQLEQRVEQMQKINRKQSKFIESVQSMRKAIQKTQTACSLKQLWRWLKVLPNSR